MRIKNICYLLSILLLSALGHTAPRPIPTPAAPSTINQQLATEHLKVGIVTNWPFAGPITQNGPMGGVAYDLWGLISKQNHFDSTYYNLEKNYDEAITLIQQHKLDVVIGAIGITPDRVRRVDFTFPYFRGEHILVAKKEAATALSAFSAIFHGNLSVIACIMVLLYFLYLNLFWYIERNNIDEMKELSYRKGLAHLFWKSLLNGFRIPLFPLGNTTRVFTGVWNLIIAASIASIIAGMTAGFVTSLNTRGNLIQSLADMKNKTVATFPGDTTVLYAKTAGLNVAYSAPSFPEAIAALDNNKVDAIFILRAFFLDYLNVNSRKDLYIASLKFPHDYLAFMVSDAKKNLLRKINYSIVSATVNGQKYEICNLYKNYINVDNCK